MPHPIASKHRNWTELTANATDLTSASVISLWYGIFHCTQFTVIKLVINVSSGLRLRLFHEPVADMLSPSECF